MWGCGATFTAAHVEMQRSEGEGQGIQEVIDHSRTTPQNLHLICKSSVTELKVHRRCQKINISGIKRLAPPSCPWSHISYILCVTHNMYDIHVARFPVPLVGCTSLNWSQIDTSRPCWERCQNTHYRLLKEHKTLFRLESWNQT